MRDEMNKLLVRLSKAHNVAVRAHHDALKDYYNAPADTRNVADTDATYRNVIATRNAYIDAARKPWRFK